MKRFSRMTAAALALVLLLSITGCGASDGKTHLTFQIWDVAQRASMEAICAAYTAKHPEVDIEVQVTNWTEYWTKLEAAAESNTMPDIFWMHTNQILYYADFGMLADVTDLYADEDPSYYQNHFSDISIGNASGSDGRLYGVPKDKDNVVLVYNKEMFDAAGVAYPDENWTWDDLVSASAQIYDKTGKYGYMAYNDDQMGYWSFVYQAGGCILTEDKTRAGFDQPGTRKGMEFYVGLQDYEWCPDQSYFAETAPGTAFFSGIGSMYIEGNWELMNKCVSFPDMNGKWDIAPMPKCPDPVSGDGRATISNGLCYSTAARGKTRDIALDVIKFFGTEEAQLLASSYGAAVSAYNGTEQPYFDAFDKAGYDINVPILMDQFAYGVQNVNNAAKPKWKSPVLDELNKVYNGQQSLDSALDNMQNIIDTETAKKLADN
ncbi:MAG: sugar ABC transporter substrate-binding protein [Oscillospiraceae bacterium]|nr:sugar ABC transporter substrate-binding protein [Oscillospiraceae bacterium]